jgi:hypothetical protein
MLISSAWWAHVSDVTGTGYAGMDHTQHPQIQFFPKGHWRAYLEQSVVQREETHFFQALKNGADSSSSLPPFKTRTGIMHSDDGTLG